MVGISLWSVPGIPEIVPGDDLNQIIADAVTSVGGVGNGALLDGDIVIITSKIVSKAEGRRLNAADREDAITAETVRVVATKAHAGGVTRIVENRLGLVLAAAGVDSSNTDPGTILLLPVDPDSSARGLCAALRKRFDARVAVVVSDTLGRPWRLGQTDVAIGAAGLRVLDDLRGSVDAGGRTLDATITAVADEIAAAADLVKGKAGALPVAVLRGLGHLVGDLTEPGARSIVRPTSDDLFSQGTAESYRDGYRDGHRDAQREAQSEARAIRVDGTETSRGDANSATSNLTAESDKVL
ncbi:MAG: coenzyme F420-0:L-glutamate ligase [Terrimesophilobacter sp.]